MPYDLKIWQLVIIILFGGYLLFSTLFCRASGFYQTCWMQRTSTIRRVFGIIGWTLVGGVAYIALMFDRE